MSKIISLTGLIEERKKWREQGQKVVMTNGCFDLLHGGHIWLFQQAKSLGDILIVAVNTDESISQLKGKGRPIFPLEERLEILEAIEFIDYLLPFSELTPYRIISALLPDVLVKGGDWPLDQIVGRQAVEEAGGQVVTIPYRQGKSTSEIIKAIISKNRKNNYPQE